MSRFTNEEWESLIEEFKKENDDFSLSSNDDVKLLFIKAIKGALRLSNTTDEELRSVSQVFFNLNVESPWGLYGKLWMYLSSHCRDWKKRRVPVRPIGLEDDAEGFADEVALRTFAILTTSWIAAGGLFQFLIVVFLFYRRDSRLQVLPKCICILLLIASPVLLGPVVVYVFGVFFVIKNIETTLIGKDIQR